MSILSRQIDQASRPGGMTGRVKAKFPTRGRCSNARHECGRRRHAPARVDSSRSTTRVPVTVFDTVKEAVKATGANATVIFVPAKFAADAVLEAIDSGVAMVVCITEGIPIRDEMVFANVAAQKGVRLVGPNCPGLLTVGECKIGHYPAQHLHARPGRRGFALRHPHLRSGRRSHSCGPWTDHLRRCRRRPHARHPLYRRPPAFRGGPGDQGRRYVRRSRRPRYEEIAAEYIKSMTKPEVVGFIAGADCARPASAWATPARSYQVHPWFAASQSGSAQSRRCPGR